jgi:hypothetical protein
MKIKILTSASQDLIDGYRFYEKQSEGLGSYFLDTLYSDIDSLATYLIEKGTTIPFFT